MFSKNGSIPKAETDGTDGWIEVPDAPESPEGKEVVWWYPPGWVIRDPKPAGNSTIMSVSLDIPIPVEVPNTGNLFFTSANVYSNTTWSWSQSTEQWVEYSLPNVIIETYNVVTILDEEIPTADEPE